MIQYIYSYFDKIRNRKIRRFGTLIVRTLVNIILPIYYRLSATPFLREQKKHSLVISLTSFPARINKVWIVIESLLRQTMQADRIILYLSENDFPNKEDELPYALKRLKKYGLEIVFVEGNLRSHKKWFYVFQDFRNEYVITADDDIIYPTDMIKLLWEAHQKNPKMVIARYAKQIRFTSSGIAPYNTWGKVQNNPSYSISFGSGGGCLFPIRLIDKGIFAKDVFINICPNADDLWLYTFMRISNLKIYLLEGRSCSILNVQILHDSRLTTTNCGEGENDRQMACIMEYIKMKYGLTYKIFEDERNF